MLVIWIECRILSCFLSFKSVYPCVLLFLILQFEHLSNIRSVQISNWAKTRPIISIRYVIYLQIPFAFFSYRKNKVLGHLCFLKLSIKLQNTYFLIALFYILRVNIKILCLHASYFKLEKQTLLKVVINFREEVSSPLMYTNLIDIQIIFGEVWLIFYRWANHIWKYDCALL